MILVFEMNRNSQPSDILLQGHSRAKVTCIKFVYPCICGIGVGDEWEQSDYKPYM